MTECTFKRVKENYVGKLTIKALELFAAVEDKVKCKYFLGISLKDECKVLSSEG